MTEYNRLYSKMSISNVIHFLKIKPAVVYTLASPYLVRALFDDIFVKRSLFLSNDLYVREPYSDYLLAVGLSPETFCPQTPSKGTRTVTQRKPTGLCLDQGFYYLTQNVCYLPSYPSRQHLKTR